MSDGISQTRPVHTDGEMLSHTVHVVPDAPSEPPLCGSGVIQTMP
jgi:hypothetical protein